MIGSLRDLGLVRQPGIVGGVLAGLAQRFGISAGLLRVAFIISIILPGPQILLYVVLWILMPKA